MPVKEVAEILQAFVRYVEYINNHGHDEVVVSIIDNYHTLLITMRGHMGEAYELEVYLSGTTGELCIEDPCTHVSLFDYKEELLDNITDEELRFIRTGKKEEKK